MAGTNRELAAQAVAWALAHGVSEVVLCAGARNLALVEAWEIAPGVRLWNAFEERSAGFFALGRMQAGAGPVAVVVTSGTAVAELMPSAVEGFYQGLPLLLMTADRPRRFRGTAAPQSIRQAGIFGEHAVMVADAEPGDGAEDWRWLANGPAQMNLCFEEEDGGEVLAELPVCRVEAERSRAGVVPDAVIRWLLGAAESGRLWVVVGKLEADEAGPVAEWLACGNAPLWLESTSQLWGRPELEARWIRNGETAQAEATHVLRLGGVPNGRFWRDLEIRPDIEVCSLSRGGFRGLGRAAAHFAVDLAALAGCDLPDGADSGFAARCRERDRTLQSNPPSGEAGFVAALSAAIPSGSAVFLGNSLPIRHWQDVGAWRAGLRIFANRGANGIDGEGSSFLGVAEGTPEAWCLLGDLTALYDLAAPWMQEQMNTRRLRWVVLNNRGGGIFAKLPRMRDVPAAVRGRILNSHALDFRHWADMWGMKYIAWSDPSDTAPVSAAAGCKGPVVLECVAASE